jgi:hypothetical protein
MWDGDENVYEKPTNHENIVQIWRMFIRKFTKPST